MLHDGDILVKGTGSAQDILVKGTGQHNTFGKGSAQHIW